MLAATSNLVLDALLRTAVALRLAVLATTLSLVAIASSHGLLANVLAAVGLWGHPLFGGIPYPLPLPPNTKVP